MFNCSAAPQERIYALADIIKQVQNFKVVIGLWAGYTRDWRKACDRGSVCQPCASGTLELISRQLPVSLFTRLEDGCSQGQPEPRKQTPVGMDSHQRRNYLPFPVQGADVFDLLSLSQKQIGWAATPPQNTAGGKRNHFMVHSLLSPGEGQQKQWVIIWEVLRGYSDGEFRTQ